MTMHMLGCVELSFLNYDAASGLLEGSIAPLRRIGDHEQVAWSLVFLGIVSRCTGDHEKAMARFEEGLALFREVGLVQGAGYALCEMGIVATRRGDLESADNLLKQSLVTVFEAADRMATAKAMEALADVETRRGEFVRSAQLLASAQTVRTEIGGPVEAYEMEAYEALLATTSHSLGKARFAQAWAGGAAMTLTEAVRFALADQSALATLDRNDHVLIE